MATQTFACPACGTHKTLDDPMPGEKLHCTCGMSFPASPVFAVPTVARGNRMTGRGWAVGVAAALLIGTAAAAGWLMSRPQARTRDRTTEPVLADASTAPQAGPTTSPPDNPPPKHDTPGGTTTPPDKAPNPNSNPNPPPQPPPAPATPAVNVSAVTLWDAYDLDQAAAAAKYNGKLLEVTARGKVATDSLGKPYFGAVVVKPRGKVTPRMSQDEKTWERDGYPPSVRFYLTADQAAELAAVPADRDVVIRGTCTGRKDRQGVYRGYTVELENCTAVTK